MLLADEGRPSFSAHAAMRVGLTRSARSSCRPPPLHRRGTRCPVGGTIGTVKHRDSSCQWTVTPRPAPCQRVPTQRGQRRGLVRPRGVSSELIRGAAGCGAGARRVLGRRCAGAPPAAVRGQGERQRRSRPGLGHGTAGGSAATLPPGDRRWECDRSQTRSMVGAALGVSAVLGLPLLHPRSGEPVPPTGSETSIVDTATTDTLVDTSTTLVDSSTCPALVERHDGGRQQHRARHHGGHDRPASADRRRRGR